MRTGLRGPVSVSIALLLLSQSAGALAEQSPALPAGLVRPPGPSAGMEPAPPMIPPPFPNRPPGKDFPPPVDMKVSREQAIAKARDLFQIPAELGEPNVNVTQSPQGMLWNLSWQSPRKQAESISINVSVDGETGEIRNANRWRFSPDAVAPLTFTRSEAFLKALAWRQRLAPRYGDLLRLLDTSVNPGYFGPGNASYQFHWDRVAEGYPVQGDGIDLTISARTGELESYALNWRPDLAFRLPATVMSRPDAVAAYTRQFKLTMQYQLFQKPGTDELEWQLIYRPQTYFYPNLNQQGQATGPDGSPVDPALYQEPERVPAPDKPYQAPAKPLTREQALALAQGVSGRTDEPTSSNYSEYGEEEKTRSWDFSWITPNELTDGDSNVNVRIDADGGVVMAFNQWSQYQPMNEGEEPTVTEAEARAIAVEFVRTYRPDLAGSAAVFPSVGPQGPKEAMVRQIQPTQYVRFATLHDGILVADREMSVEVDIRTGKVRSFWSMNAKSRLPTGKAPQFPTTEGVVPAGEAVKTIVRHLAPDLRWVSYWMPPTEKGRTESYSVPQLLWTPSMTLQPAGFAAKTGAPLDYQGRDLEKATKRLADIDGHFAQREIELLWARGIFETTDGLFNPAEQATAADLARWLVLARGMQPYRMYDFMGAYGGGAGGMEMAEKMANASSAPYFGAAFQAGILLPEDLDPSQPLDTPVSRERFALWAARAMGYGAVVKMANRIEMSFADRDQVGAKYANAAALLQGLGIVKGDGQGFAPQRLITRGEAAKILFGVSAEMRR